MKLLTTNNTKTEKGEKAGYLTGILHLAPSTLSGYNVCPKASKGCAKACLNTAGFGRFKQVQEARKKKTLKYFLEREKFEADLEKDIQILANRAKNAGKKPAVRINGTSDLPALAIKMAEKFPDIQFYDYSKIVKTAQRKLPKNYHLTFSRSECNEDEVLPMLDKGFNVAAVFEDVPKIYKGYEVISGDEDDLRFLDKKGVIVGLIEKGHDGKADDSGFVIRNG